MSNPAFEMESNDIGDKSMPIIDYKSQHNDLINNDSNK